MCSLRVLLRRLRASVASLDLPPSPQLSNPSSPLLIKTHGQCVDRCWALGNIPACHGPPASWAWLRRPRAVCQSLRRAFRPSARRASTRPRLFGPRLPARALAMPKKKKTAATPQGKQDAGRVEATAASLDARYRQSPAGQAPSEEVMQGAVAAVGPSVVGGSSGSAAAPEVPMSQARLASVLLHRQTGDGPHCDRVRAGKA